MSLNSTGHGAKAWFGVTEYSFAGLSARYNLRAKPHPPRWCRRRYFLQAAKQLDGSEWVLMRQYVQRSQSRRAPLLTLVRYLKPYLELRS